MVGHVTHTGDLRNTRNQGLLDPFLECYIRHAAALATATELQHRDTTFNYVDQLDLTAMAGQARIDLGLQQVVDTVVQRARSEEHTSELQSRENLVCRLLLEKKK